METKINELIAFCGYYCGDCIKYKSEISKLADRLSIKINITEFPSYIKAKSECTDKHIEQTCTYRDFQTFRSVLDFIKTQQCNSPCRAGGDGCADACPVKDCVADKELQGCWECLEIETCHKTDFLTSFWGDILKKNIKLIKKHGLNNWLEYRPKGYIWMK